MFLHAISYSQEFNYKIFFQEVLDPNNYKITIQDIIVPIVSENNSLVRMNTTEDRSTVHIVTKSALDLEAIQTVLEQKHGLTIKQQ